MTVPFLSFEHVNEGPLEEFLDELKELAVSPTLDHSPVIQKFEEGFAKFIGNRACVSVGSGADAVMLALRSIGIAPGDEVIVPAFANPALANAAARIGAQVVFVDVRPEFYTLDPDKTLASITGRTKAIVPTHIFGHAMEIDRVVTVARTYSVVVIEDCRDAIGGRVGSRRLGTYGDFGAFSFHPASLLGALGEGGALTTNNEERAGVIRQLRENGCNADGVCELVGYNSRLDAIQAAFLQHKIQDLDENVAECIENARLYDRMFAGSPVRVPPFTDDGAFTYSSYVVSVPDRDKLTAVLDEKGIGYEIPVPTPLHLLPAFAYLEYREGAFPIAEELSRSALALPVRPGLKKRQVEEVADTILEFYGVKA